MTCEYQFFEMTDGCRQLLWLAAYCQTICDKKTVYHERKDYDCTKTK